MSDTVIRADKLSKLYRLGVSAGYGTLREALMKAATAPWRVLRRTGEKTSPLPNGYIWALKDVSFEVKQGEVVGIIGRNGSGKSTLLKILTQITTPTEGYAEIYGRVGALLEVGTGFHPELTGRENIYLNGAVLGMKRAEIRRKFDEIVEFSGVEKFIDTPIKRYSSGMQVRLAFSVAAHLEPEILLIDEVLAVGDALFQKKCLGKMGDISRQGRTVLFVSHNMAAVQNLCSRAMMLEDGRVASIGDVGCVVGEYIARISASKTPLVSKSGPAALNLSILNVKSEQTDIIECGQKLVFVAKLSVEYPLKRAGFGVGITTMTGERIVTFHSHYQCSHTWQINNQCVCTIEWPENCLCPGNYLIVAALYDSGELLASWTNLGGFTVVANDYFGTGKLPDTGYQGHILARSHWHIDTGL